MKKAALVLIAQLTLIAYSHALSIAKEFPVHPQRLEFTYDLRYQLDEESPDIKALSELFQLISEKRLGGWCEVEVVRIFAEFDSPKKPRGLAEDRTRNLVKLFVQYGFPKERIYVEMKQRNPVTSLLPNSETVHLEFAGFSKCNYLTNPPFNSPSFSTSVPQ